MLHWLRRDFRDYPATMTICALWIVVYAAMLATAVSHGEVASWRGWLLGTPAGERFGDMSLRDLARGQYWRVLTSTFVHYGLVHLAMNLFGMYQLGSLLEEWYGSWQILALYVVIGAGGNAVSADIRQTLGSAPNVHSGGGSTVLLGFVGLCAVVGWRSRTRMGDFLRKQMVAILAYTALLGVALPLVSYFVPVPLIDNWGHAGGALVGALVGFAHRWLERQQGRRRAVWAGAAGMVVLAACAGLQWRTDRAEAPRRALVRLERARATADALARAGFQYEVDFRIAQRLRRVGRGAFVGKDRRRAIALAVAQLDQARPALDNGSTRDDYQRVRALLEKARSDPPGPRDFAAFAPPFRRLVARARRSYDAAAAGYKAVAPEPVQVKTTSGLPTRRR
jgi:rhomboid protease GluP